MLLLVMWRSSDKIRLIWLRAPLHVILRKHSTKREVCHLSKYRAANEGECPSTRCDICDGQITPNYGPLRPIDVEEEIERNKYFRENDRTGYTQAEPRHTFTASFPPRPYAHSFGAVSCTWLHERHHGTWTPRPVRRVYGIASRMYDDSFSKTT